MAELVDTAPREPAGTSATAAAAPPVPISDRLFEKRPPTRSIVAETESVGAGPTAPSAEEAAPPELDEAAEAAFLAEARERGEIVAPPKAAETEEREEPLDPKALPPLNELVEQIPVEVREVLEDLFRARFVTVKRFPKKVLKQS